MRSAACLRAIRPGAPSSFTVHCTTTLRRFHCAIRRGTFQPSILRVCDDIENPGAHGSFATGGRAFAPLRPVADAIDRATDIGIATGFVKVAILCNAFIPTVFSLNRDGEDAAVRTMFATSMRTCVPLAPLTNTIDGYADLCVAGIAFDVTVHVRTVFTTNLVYYFDFVSAELGSEATLRGTIAPQRPASHAILAFNVSVAALHILSLICNDTLLTSMQWLLVHQESSLLCSLATIIAQRPFRPFSRAVDGTRENRVTRLGLLGAMAFHTVLASIIRRR